MFLLGVCGKGLTSIEKFTWDEHGMLFKKCYPPENNILWADVQSADQNAAWQKANAFLLMRSLCFIMKCLVKNMKVECSVV